MILNGKPVADEILKQVKVEAEKTKPKLGIVLVGNNPASQKYVKTKMERAKEVGIKTEVFRLPEKTKKQKLLSLIQKLNKSRKIDGFIVQLPLPNHINQFEILSSVDPKKDVDGFSPYNLGALFSSSDPYFIPATPQGILHLLEHYGAKIEGANAVVIGRSVIVGKPVSVLLLQKNATVTLCHSKTKNLAEHTKKADILIAAAGSPGLVKSEMVKEGAYIIDVGTTDVGGKLVGDVDFENVIKKAHCSPVPGGVGPLTVAYLLKNTLIAAKRRRKK
ncbi:MAG: bifunctional 5,10-methylenetetrahydrofolate dehydrogenase/5,10-methenyltetrahydrofolate cyclohydrolase [Candidatus Anstonellales archaeon]